MSNTNTTPCPTCGSAPTTREDLVALVREAAIEVDWMVGCYSSEAVVAGTEDVTALAAAVEELETALAVLGRWDAEHEDENA